MGCMQGKSRPTANKSIMTYGRTSGSYDVAVERRQQSVLHDGVIDDLRSDTDTR